MKWEEIVGEALRRRSLTMATAESCTGGMVAEWMTAVPGSSDYFKGGVVSYCNEVKASVLGVPREALERWGAVSRPVVEAMALGVASLLHAEGSVAISGVAGPGGGSPEKPVGTVWIAAALHGQVVARRYHFLGDRTDVRRQAATVALQMLYDLLPVLQTKG